jgi:hypothetical protein
VYLPTQGTCISLYMVCVSPFARHIYLSVHGTYILLYMVRVSPFARDLYPCFCMRISQRKVCVSPFARHVLSLRKIFVSRCARYVYLRSLCKVSVTPCARYVYLHVQGICILCLLMGGAVTGKGEISMRTYGSDMQKVYLVLVV